MGGKGGGKENRVVDLKLARALSIEEKVYLFSFIGPIYSIFLDRYSKGTDGNLVSFLSLACLYMIEVKSYRGSLSRELFYYSLPTRFQITSGTSQS